MLIIMDGTENIFGVAFFYDDVREYEQYTRAGGLTDHMRVSYDDIGKRFGVPQWCCASIESKILDANLQRSNGVKVLFWNIDKIVTDENGNPTGQKAADLARKYCGLLPI